MKTTLISFFCLLLILCAGTYGKDQATSSPLQKEILFQVRSQSSYADPEDVVLDCVITNQSKMAMVVVSHGLERIKLHGPDGRPVRPYAYRPSGMGSRMYALECYPPGGRCERGLRLSGLFPFPVEGKYSCTLIQRVYLWDSPEMPDTSDLIENDYYGKPFDVAVEEITFNMEKSTPASRDIPKVDPQNGFNEPGLEYNPMDSKNYPLRGEGHYKPVHQEAVNTKASPLAVSPAVPPLAQAPAPKKAPEAKPTLTTPSEETNSSTPWSIIVVLVVSAIGLLWLLVKNRK